MIDETIPVSDEDALTMAHEVASREGLLVGISAGRRDSGGARASRRARGCKGKRIVTIACDGGERYMSLPFFLDG